MASKRAGETLIARETIPRHYFLQSSSFRVVLEYPRARANSPPLLRTCYSARRGTVFQLAGSSAIWIILSRKERFLISNSPNVRCFCCTGRLARYLPRNASASAPRHFVNVPFPRGKLFESLFYRSIFQVKPSIHILHCPSHLKSDGHFTFHASFDRFQKRYPSVFASMNARRYEIAMKCYGWSVSQIYPIYVTPLNSCENRLGEYFLLILSSKFLPFFFNHRLIELSSKIFRGKKNTRQQKQTIYPVDLPAIGISRAKLVEGVSPVGWIDPRNARP